MDEDVLTKRREGFIKYFKSQPYLLIYIALGLIAWFGYSIRTRNLGLLYDVTTGDYIPVALDPFVFLRYVEDIVANGTLMAVDTLRYFPEGFSRLAEFKIVSYTVAYFYKFLNFFDPSVTVAYAHVIYPAVAFVFGLVAFFFLMRSIFNWKVALLGSGFLTVLPAYLYRTMAGFSDKEALAMIFMFVGLMLVAKFMYEKRFKWAAVYAALAGLDVAALWLIWGGAGFLILTIGVFFIGVVMLGRLTKKNLYLYSIFMAVFVFVYQVGFAERAGSLIDIETSLITSHFSGMLFLALVLAWLHYLLFMKDVFKIKEKVKIPHTYASLAVLALLGFIAISIWVGPSYIWQQIGVVFTLLTSPQNFDRWTLTVAESHQPYFVDLVGQFGWDFLILVWLGCMFLFYETFKSLGEKKGIYLSVAFGVFFAAFAMSRYSSSSAIFNGASNLSTLVYIGSGFVFMAYFGYELYMHHHKVKERLSKIDLGYMLILIFFFFTLMGARSAVRLLFTFAPATAMLGAVGGFLLLVYLWRLKQPIVKYASVVVVVLLMVMMLNGFSQSVLAQASGTGPSYNNQWQIGMDWVRENTAEDSVFASWWDYGYWIQAGGDRATISDGGNARSGINYFVGRALLTGHSEREALELLAANQVTHVLMISDEIGKYGAYSSIGSDANYDRFGYIGTFGYDASQSTESRDGVNLVYTGGVALDEDLNYQGQFFPASSTGLYGFIVPTILDESGLITGIDQPLAAVASGDTFVQVPLRCVFYNGQEYRFGSEEDEMLEGCIQLVPRLQSGVFEEIGMVFYYSPRVYSSNFVHMYMFGEDYEYMDLVYSDEESVPLMYYEGMIIGPMKIWEVTGYPDDLEIPEEYYTGEIPEEVRAV